jgi:hypothetical protein
MGLFNWLTGDKPAPAGVKRQSEAKLREALIGVARKSAGGQDGHRQVAGHPSGTRTWSRPTGASPSRWARSKRGCRSGRRP